MLYKIHFPKLWLKIVVSKLFLLSLHQGNHWLVWAWREKLTFFAIRQSKWREVICNTSGLHLWFNTVYMSGGESTVVRLLIHHWWMCLLLFDDCKQIDGFCRCYCQSTVSITFSITVCTINIKKIVSVVIDGILCN